MLFGANAAKLPIVAIDATGLTLLDIASFVNLKWEYAIDATLETSFSSGPVDGKPHLFEDMYGVCASSKVMIGAYIDLLSAYQYKM